MRDAFYDLLLRIRRTQPGEWEDLDPAVKLEALNYESRQRERLELENEERTKTRTNGNPEARPA